MRLLTVENTGGGLAFAKAIYVSGTSGTLRHVTARASGATSENQGIFVDGAASPTVADATIFVDGGATSANSLGFLNVGATTTVMRNIDSFATGGSFAQAFFNFGAAPDMQRVHGIATNASSTSVGLNNLSGTSVTIRDSSFIASGPANAFGIQNNSSGVTLENVRAVGTTTGAAFAGVGISNFSASLSTFDSYAQGSGAGSTYGMNAGTSNISATRSHFIATGTTGYGFNSFSSSAGPYVVKIDGSTLQGATGSLVTNGTSTTTVSVGGTHLIGPTAVAAPSSHTCAATWNAAYAFFAGSLCPP
jgi:hypothetical protein